MVRGFAEANETAALELDTAGPLWIEVADKVRRQYGFGNAAQPTKFLQVYFLKILFHL